MPRIRPILHRLSFHAQLQCNKVHQEIHLPRFPVAMPHLIKQPVVSLRMAQTSILTSPLRSSASCSSTTTSSPSTPSQLKPLVHLTSRPLARPSCCRGKEKVKPSGNTSCWMFLSTTKLAKHLRKEALINIGLHCSLQ